jgi:hypothetical protein
MTFIGDSLTRRLAVSWGMYTAINTSAPHAAQAISTIDLSSANLLVLLSGHNHTADCDPGGHAPLCCDHISFELVSTDKCVAHGGGVRGGRVEQGASWLTAVNAQGAHLFGRSPFNSLRVEWAPKLAGGICSRARAMGGRGCGSATRSSSRLVSTTPGTTPWAPRAPLRWSKASSSWRQVASLTLVCVRVRSEPRSCCYCVGRLVLCIKTRALSSLRHPHAIVVHAFDSGR